jgi:MoCo/4Fe-4S cofactor protein with predicted Tat translocation signal
MSGADTQRRAYWRSLEELAEMPEIAARLEREMTRSGRDMGTVERRRFLQLMAASLALGGLSGCGPEENPRQLLPYVEQPPGIVPGLARAYATAVTESGYATGQDRRQPGSPGEPRRRQRDHAGEHPRAL